MIVLLLVTIDRIMPAHRCRCVVSPTWILVNFRNFFGIDSAFLLFNQRLFASFLPSSLFPLLHGIHQIPSLASSIESPTMPSITETTSAPHLRVSAAKSQEPKADSGQQQLESPRVSPPPSVVEDQFFWTYTEEPHRSRRQAIIKAHPEVKCHPVYLAVNVPFRPTFIPAL